MHDERGDCLIAPQGSARPARRLKKEVAEAASVSHDCNIHVLDWRLHFRQFNVIVTDEQKEARSLSSEKLVMSSMVQVQPLVAECASFEALSIFPLS